MTLSRRFCRIFIRLLTTVPLALVAGLAVLSHRQHAHADALWRLVANRCVPDQLSTGHPAPCAAVHVEDGREHGFVLMKDAYGATQYLLLPTLRVTGIESPALRAPHPVNYFADAWAATQLVDERLGRVLPRQDFALAVNSAAGRTQNQLHIHIDCIRPDVEAALATAAPQTRPTWQALPAPLAGHRYRALWLPGETLADRDPFLLLAASLRDPAHEMDAHTLVLAGAVRDGQPGFLLLDSRAPWPAAALDRWVQFGFAVGEELEDHSCRVAQRPS